jgi:hypothetical protein
MVWHFDGRGCMFVSSRWWSGIQRGLFFGSSSSGHVRVASPMMRERKRGGDLFRKETVQFWVLF